MILYFNRTKVLIKKDKDIAPDRLKRKTNCLVCGSVLADGDRLISHEYKGGKESIVHVFGCRSCYKEKIVRERICPICRKILPETGYLMGKMWEENGKRRLHIIACTECGGIPKRAGKI